MSSPAAPADAGLNIMPSYGAVLIGCFLAQAIWGVSTVQVFIYFQSYEKDKLPLKLLVVLLWIIDTVNQILLLKSLFPVLILQYGRVAGLLDNQTEIAVHNFTSAVVAFVVQMYFIRRIYVFGKRYIAVKILSAALLIPVFWEIAGPIVYWVRGFGEPLTDQIRPYFVDINISLRAAPFVVDVAIALCMIWLLTWNQASFISQTKKMVLRILIVTVNSGTWTALLALLTLIMLKVFPVDLYFCVFDFPQCTLYFSTFMANLNSRNYVRGEDGALTVFGTNPSIPGRTPTMALESMRLPSSAPSKVTTLTISGTKPSGISITTQKSIYMEPEYSSKAFDP